MRRAKAVPPPPRPHGNRGIASPKRGRKRFAPQQVRSIRELSAVGCSQRAIAKLYRVSPVAIFKIVHRRSYAWIE